MTIDHAAERGGRNGVALTERELEVLELLATYIPRGRIATELHISTNTVKTHIAHVYRSLGVNSRDDAIATALRLGLLHADGSTRTGAELQMTSRV